MDDISKKYSNGEINIIWKPSLCIHSKKCWSNLPNVFNPREKPWIKTEGVSSETIKSQIDQCPSGALSYELIGNSNTSSVSNLHSINISSNGPILVHGNIELTYPDGRKEIKQKTTALCRCGASGNKPFCDGSHHKIGFKD